MEETEAWPEETEEGKEPEPETIAKRGARLPLGISHGGALHRDLAVRKWRMKEERELGELRDENKDANLAKYVSMVLATMCTRLGPHDFDKMSFDQRLLAVSQMYMGDVFYAYVWLRIAALGSEFKLTFKPSWAPKPLPITADLNSVEVRSAESAEDASWEYQLQDPIVIRGKRTTRFMLGPVRWNTLENIETLGQTANTAVVKSGMLTASITGCDGFDGPVHLVDSDLDELTKWNLESATNGVDEHSIGPNMRVEGTYKGREFKASIDWGYDRFFAISST